jgi:hypothetical protein
MISYYGKDDMVALYHKLLWHLEKVPLVPFFIDRYKSSSVDYLQSWTVRFAPGVPVSQPAKEDLAFMEYLQRGHMSAEVIAKALGVSVDAVREAFVKQLSVVQTRLEGLEKTGDKDMINCKVVYSDSAIHLTGLKKIAAFSPDPISETNEGNYRSKETRVNAFIRCMRPSYAYMNKIILKPGKFTQVDFSI